MRYNFNYKNDAGEYAPRTLTIDGRQVLNPTAAMYADAGYMPYTPPTPSEDEVAEMERLASIESLKMQLAESDYKAIKYAEGWISEEDYAPIKAARQALRDQINALEGANNNN